MQRFRDSVDLASPVETVWEYYVNPLSLAELTLPSMGMRVVKADTPLREGSRIRFALRPRGFPVEVRWDARISLLKQHEEFVDRQVRGPFEHWVHHHRFEPLTETTSRIVDTLEIGAPMGFFGRLAESFLVAQKLEELFDHRRRILVSRFGSV